MHMKIKKEIYESIVNYPEEMPPEMGGIIGSTDHAVIDTFIGDPGRKGECGCSYTPNTPFLNRMIHQWIQDNILFCGIVHTHFFDVRTLSSGDKEYIYRILEAMPADISELYFPLIVLPKREMVSYRAIIRNGQLMIANDQIKVL